MVGRVMLTAAKKVWFGGKMSGFDESWVKVNI